MRQFGSAGQPSSSPAPASSLDGSALGSTHFTHRGNTAINANIHGLADRLLQQPISADIISESTRRCGQGLEDYLSQPQLDTHGESLSACSRAYTAQAVNVGGLSSRGSVTSGSDSLGGLRRAAAQGRERKLIELEDLESVDAAAAQRAIMASLEGTLARVSSTEHDMAVGCLLSSNGYTVNEIALFLKTHAVDAASAVAYHAHLSAKYAQRRSAFDEEQPELRSACTGKSTASSTYVPWSRSRSAARAAPHSRRTSPAPSARSTSRESDRPSRSHSRERSRSPSSGTHLVSFEDDDFTGRPSSMRTHEATMSAAAEEHRQLLELLNNAGFNRDALTRLMTFVRSHDGPTLAVAQFFCDQVMSPDLVFLQFDRVVGTLLIELRREPALVHEVEARFAPAWRRAVTAEAERLNTRYPTAAPVAPAAGSVHTSPAQDHTHIAQNLFGTTAPTPQRELSPPSIAGVQETTLSQAEIAAVLERATRAGWISPANLPPSLGLGASGAGTPESGGAGESAGESPGSLSPVSTQPRVTATVLERVTALGLSAEAFSPVIWFDFDPPLARRAVTLQRSRYSQPQILEAFLHREQRRRARMNDGHRMLTLHVVLDFMRVGERAFVSRRGDFHEVLLDFRYDQVAVLGSLLLACKAIIEMLSAAAAQSSVLRPIAERVETQARGEHTDSTILAILTTIDDELLPLGDDDERALMSIEWHPTSVGDHSVRTAYALASKLSNVASAPGRTAGVANGLALRYFRSHVARARNLACIRRDEVTGRSLPDLVYEAFCTSEVMASYPTIESLLVRLKVSSGLGLTVLRELERAPSERERRRTTSQTNAAVAADDAAKVLAALDMASDKAAKKYMDIELVKQHASDVTILRVVDGQHDFKALSDMAGFMECELYNGAAPDGLYGGPDVGACPVCMWAISGLHESFTMKSFIEKFKGAPTGREGSRPVPDGAVVVHPLDDCYRIRRGLEIACNRQRPPALTKTVLEPVDAATRAARWAASKARQG